MAAYWRECLLFRACYFLCLVFGVRCGSGVLLLGGYYAVDGRDEAE